MIILSVLVKPPYGGFHSHGGTPKTLDGLFHGIPMKKWMRTGGTPILGNLHIIIRACEHCESCFFSFEWSDSGNHHKNHGDGGIAFAKSMTSIELAVVSGFSHHFTYLVFVDSLPLSLGLPVSFFVFIGHVLAFPQVCGPWAQQGIFRSCQGCHGCIGHKLQLSQKVAMKTCRFFRGMKCTKIFAASGITKCLQTYSNSLIDLLDIFNHQGLSKSRKGTWWKYPKLTQFELGILPIHIANLRNSLFWLAHIPQTWQNMIFVKLLNHRNRWTSCPDFCDSCWEINGLPVLMWPIAKCLGQVWNIHVPVYIYILYVYLGKL